MIDEKDRVGRAGGGVALHVKEGIESNLLDFSKEADHIQKSLWAAVLGFLKKKKMIRI